MRRRKWRFLTVLVIIVCCLPIVIISTSSLNLNTSSELMMSLNQRLTNNLSEFEDSPYIDYHVKRFMKRSELMGVSMAVVKDERLVFSRGYGFADIEKDELVSPQHLFRLASISKLITAVAIMNLVESGDLQLNDKVFGKNAILNDTIYGKIRDPKLKDITVKHLLEHTAGWSQRYGDPAFNPLIIARKVGEDPPANIETYLKFVYSRRLHFPPGSMYSYSNMGYMFLGKIIETVTGMTYEDYVRYHIMYPHGIYDMHLGKNFYKDKYPNEVKYYEQKGSIKISPFNGDSIHVPKSYGGNDIELLSSAGGWIASAPELAKLITLIDGFDANPDILSKKSIRLMTQNGSKPLGWKKSYSGYWYRTGSFAGTVAMIVRRPDGISWVFMSNNSNWQGPGFYDDIKWLMNRIIRKVDEWPEHDLFKFYNMNELSSKQILIKENYLSHPVN
ncbi:MAG TPA: serine hydrolase domain-containing protein [Bacteroidales bacterium]|nr:serine hydrolase domain-containing protein [Bacteroidales bacterium]